MTAVSLHSPVRVRPAAVMSTTPWRLTARGRRLVALAIACALLLSAGMALRAMASQPSNSHTVSVTVEAGDTLSQIAARSYPGLPVSEGVYRLQQANGLNGTAITAGETLLVPAA